MPETALLPCDTFPPVATLIPHAGPMVLLDEVRAYEGERLTCGVVVRDGTPFVADGHVHAIVALEYMAQGVAAFAGLQRRSDGEAPQVGFLIGCRDLRLECDRVPVGTALVVEVERVWSDGVLGQFACRVLAGTECIGSGALSVYQGALDDEAMP